MSEPGPDSVPTSADPRSKRPVKKRALTPLSQHASQVDALFAQPEKQLTLAPSLRNNESAVSRLAPPPDIVTNVQGSSAGAGSGEFHVYKASRRREYERIRLMEEETKREEADREWAVRQRDSKAKVDAKTSKNKAKRDKAKARKEAAKSGDGGGGGDDDVGADANGDGGKKGVTNGSAQKRMEKKLGPHKAAIDVRRDDGQDEHATSTALQVKAVEEIGIVIHDED